MKASYSEDSFEPSDTYKDILVTIDVSAVEQPLQITSNKKTNKITGTTNNDTIKGGDGNDELYGEKSNDSLVGGAGSDIFFYENGNDTIRDFAPSFDKIYVNAANIGSPKVKDGDVTFMIDDAFVFKDFRSHAFSYFS